MSWWRRTQLAWHVLRKERVRLLVAVVGIAFADLLIFMQLGFQGALFFSASRLQHSFRGDLFLVNPHFETMISPQSFSRDLLYRCASFSEVESIHAARLILSPWRNPVNGRSRNIMVLGVDPAVPLLNDPAIVAELPKLKGLGNVLFDRLGRPEFGPVEQLLSQGPVVTEIDRKRVQVVGLFSMGASFAADGGVICSEQTFLRILGRGSAADIEYGMLFVRGGVNLGLLQQRIQRHLGEDVRVLTRVQLEKIEEDYWRNSTGIGFIFGMGVVMGFLVGVIIVYQILHADISDHLPQYATLKAMGYGNGFLLVTLAQESVILALLGYLPGLGLSLLLYERATAATMLPITMTGERALGVLAATLVMCLISAAIAARELVSADPAEIF